MHKNIEIRKFSRKLGCIQEFSYWYIRWQMVLVLKMFFCNDWFWWNTKKSWKPVLVMREIRESESLEAGNWTNRDEIAYEASKLFSDEKLYEQMSQAINPYGDVRKG